MNVPAADDAADFLPPPLTERLGYLLRRTQLMVFQDFQDATNEFGLTPAEYSVLSILAHQPGIRQNRLAEMLAIKPANCVTLINGLEALHAVMREKLPVSGRAVALSLSPTGRQLLREMTARVNEHERRIQSRLNPDETKTLVALLNQILAP